MSDNIERTPLIKVDHLKEYFKISGKGMLHAVDDVNFEIYEGETLGLVGESGCGKSTVGNVIMRLLQQTDGKLYLEGENVFEASKEKKNDYCRKMQMIFQDPYSSLNPRKTIRSILSEAYIVQKLCPKEEIEGKIRELCDIVGISQRLLDYYPHELDGGTRQVVGIARALVMHPAVILMDEPFGALDAQTRNIMQEQLTKIIQHSERTIIFVTHSVDEALFLSDRVVVTKRPSTIYKVIDVPWDRPRDRASPEFTALRKQILTYLEQQNVMDD